MAEMWLERRADGTFAPTLDSDPSGLAVGEVIRVQWSRPRNARLHRKFFALLGVCFDHQDRYVTPEQFRHVVQIELGWADPVISESGDVHWIPRSLSFAKMDQAEFDRLYSQTLDLMIARHVKGADPRELDAAAERVLGFV
jgi:hypothetical protein